MSERREEREQRRSTERGQREDEVEMRKRMMWREHGWKGEGNVGGRPKRLRLTCHIKTARWG